MKRVGMAETKKHPNTARLELHLSDDMNVMLDKAFPFFHGMQVSFTP